jgi:ABC-2 type transport system permease protein
VKKTWIVLKTEFLNTVTRRSFILALILVPLVPAIILGVMSLLKTKEPVDESGVSISVSQIEEQLPQGYVDLAKIVNSSPEWIGEDVLLLFHQESEAVDAILTAKIRGYFVIQPDYLESGSVCYISREFNPVTSLDSTWTINSLIQYNLLGEDIDQFDAFFFPLHVQYIDLAPDEAEIGIDIGKDPYAFYIPYGMTMLFYVLILTSASLMMNSVAKEKENRVMEILVSSVNPRQLLTGKILGLGLVGLLQLVVWLGSAIILMRLGGATLKIPANTQLSVGVLIWGIVFFILGYLLYGTIMAGVGALVGSVKEASQATFIVVIPILIPLMLIGLIVNQPNSILSVALSLIPFTAPNTIMTRMAVAPIPLWQLLATILLTMGAIILLIRAVSGMFRAQLLLTGQKFSIGLFIKALRGKLPDSIKT